MNCNCCTSRNTRYAFRALATRNALTHTRAALETDLFRPIDLFRLRLRLERKVNMMRPARDTSRPVTFCNRLAALDMKPGGVLCVCRNTAIAYVENI